MKYDNFSLSGVVASVGMALSMFWPAVAGAQNQQDCADTKRLVALAFDDFPGMHGKAEKRNASDFSFVDLAKPVPGYKSCQLFVYSSLKKDSPTLVCDLMKSADVSPLEAVQTSEIMRVWQSTINSLATDAAQCLGAKLIGPRTPSKPREGFEEERWYLTIDQPRILRYA